MTHKELNNRQHSTDQIFRLFDLTSIALSLYLAMSVYGISNNIYYMFAVTLAMFFFYLVAQANNIYYTGLGSTMTHRIGLVVLSSVITFLMLLTVAYLTKTTSTYSRVTISLWFVFIVFFLILWRLVLCRIRATRFKNKKNLKSVAILGVNDVGNDIAKTIDSDFSLGYDLYGFFDDRDEGDDRMLAEFNYPIIGNINDIIEKAKQGAIEVIYVTLPLAAEKRILFILDELRNSTVSVHIIPNFFIYNILHARWHNVASYQALSIYDTPFYGVGSFVKRLEDIVLSSIIMLIISIPMLIIAMAIKLTSRGPVIFKQKRYGISGKEVTIYKFRSMTVCENDSKTIKQAEKNDARITKLGSFLRKTSLDELPQFINVLQGHMSIVGPRPHAIAHNEEYRQKVNGYMLRHIVKPGISGLAQINGYRGETKLLEQMEKRIEYDLKYIRNWSLTLDIKIIFLTIFKGFLNKNAY